MLIYFYWTSRNIHTSQYQSHLFLMTYIRSVRTRFDLNPEREWIQAHVVQTINLQSAGKKSQSESWAKILGFSVKRLELQVQFMQRVSLDISQCYDFRIIFSPPSFFLSSSYILWLLYLFPHPRVDLTLKVLFHHLSCPFLNLPFLARRLPVYCSGITSTLMWPEGQLGGI